jgi:hypothetical protein
MLLEPCRGTASSAPSQSRSRLHQGYNKPIYEGDSTPDCTCPINAMAIMKPEPMATSTKRKTPFRRKVYWWCVGRYWSMVRVFNRREYLRHLVYNAPADLYDEEFEELALLETEHWTRRGMRVHVSPRDIPLAEGQTSHWSPARYSDDLFIAYASLLIFKRLVEEHEHIRKKRNREVGGEYWLKWLTFLAAATGAGVAIYNLLHPAAKLP